MKRSYPSEEEVENLFLMPVLKISSPMMRDEAVRSLQRRLNALMPNLKLKEDSCYGFETEKGVRAFQAANKMRVDGIVGPQTWGKLTER